MKGKLGECGKVRKIFLRHYTATGLKILSQSTYKFRHVSM
jgi:hypothetical protein